MSASKDHNAAFWDSVDDGAAQAERTKQLFADLADALAGLIYAIEAGDAFVGEKLGGDLTHEKKTLAAAREWLERGK